MKLFVVLLVLLVLLPAWVSEARTRLFYPATLQPLPPAEVRLVGPLGDRWSANLENWLLPMSEELLCGCFETHDVQHPWVGEFAGKWLDAAVLCYQVSPDERLREKLIRVVDRLVAAQEPDGYLGTYPEGKRFIFEGIYTWDVWVHKYTLLGLLRYVEETENAEALTAARRIGDLLITTFGEAPGQKDILSAGTFNGMAATSLLQPVVYLYKLTGEQRYLDFAHYLVRRMDDPDGPGLVTALLEGKSVAETPQTKAYELLSNLVGLVELYGITGEKRLLRAAELAWDDIRANRLYITGGASSGELFRPDGVLPFSSRDNIQETCVTFSWLQLTSYLLGTTGEAKYADAYLDTACNQLLGAQAPDGKRWCYYCPLTGLKPYSTEVHCCSSNGPRGIAWLAQHCVWQGAEGPVVALPSAGAYGFHTPGAREGWLYVSGDFPFGEEVTLRLKLEAQETFTLRLLAPTWATGATCRLPDGEKVTFPAGPAWLDLNRKWKSGDVIKLDFNFQTQLVQGEEVYPGYAAIKYGPLVLAYDSTLIEGDRGHEWQADCLPASVEALDLEPVEKRPEGPLYSVNVFSRLTGRESRLPLVPWAIAGSSGGQLRIWLPDFTNLGTEPDWSLFAFYSESSQSRTGNVSEPFNDDDPGTFSVTFTGGRLAEDWFAVELTQPVTFTRLVYVHGRSFHDGGWFDASSGKPRFEIKRTVDGQWEPLVVLESYPDTTARDARGLVGGEVFETRVPATRAVAVRILGAPSCGDNPAQAFASCAELEAFAE